MPLTLEEFDAERHGQADAAIVAYPHGAAAPVVAALHERGVRVVDLSADFRLRLVDIYEQWYVPHPHPELIGEAVYGLPELRRAQIEGADIVANPGCFPTAALLALAPLAPWLRRRRHRRQDRACRAPGARRRRPRTSSRPTRT